MFQVTVILLLHGTWNMEPDIMMFESRFPKILKNAYYRYAAVSLAIVFLTACSSTENTLRTGFESGKYRTIVALGDSIVEGYGVSEGWPEMLARNLVASFPDVRVINAGRSGDTAGQGFSRLDDDVLSHNPDLVLVSFGLNDMKNGHTVELFRQDLGKVVDRISAHGATVVLLTTTRLQKGTSMVARFNPAPFNETIRAIAEGKGVWLIDVNKEAGGLNTSKYLLDAAHPNTEGYRKLARIIETGLIE